MIRRSEPQNDAVAYDDDVDGSERRWHLVDQRDFLLRSLADLNAERDADDIGRPDYEALRRRDEEHLGAVEAELAELDKVTPAPAPAPALALAQERSSHGAAEALPSLRRRRRLWLAVIGVVALSAATTLLVVHLASPRLPGAPETGSIGQNLAQRIQTQLAQATVLIDEGSSSSLTQALSLYRSVLSEDPDQPQALAETGWLEWEAGYTGGDRAAQNAGRALIEHSLKVEANDFGAHLFLGTIDLEQDHDASAAVAQYELFLAEHPPKDRVADAAGLLKEAYQEAGQAPPAALSN